MTLLLLSSQVLPHIDWTAQLGCDVLPGLFSLLRLDSLTMLISGSRLIGNDWHLAAPWCAYTT